MAARTRKATHRKPKARTEDVLGQDLSKTKINPHWQRQLERLLKLRNDLLRRQEDSAGAAREEKPEFSMHEADAATDNYDRDFALAMLSAEQDSLYEIDQALDRIRRGTYGICELTGKPIERSRLEAIPWARFTSPAEKELERQGALKHAQLGRLDALTREEASESSNEGDGT
jgi:RNA polymerase-binding transcription factor DksA